MHYFRKRLLWGVLIFVLPVILLAACGDEQNTNPDKDLPRDRLLFLSNRDGWPDLYTVDLTGKTTGRLTESAEAEFDASWSPNGSQVVFTGLSGDQAAGDYDKNRQVVVVDASGKNRKIIATEAARPRWSPDGSNLLYLRLTTDGNNSPATAPVVTTTPGFSNRVFVPGSNQPASLKGTLLVSATSGDSIGKTLVADKALYGVWSPDGKRIAYVGGTNELANPRGLFVVNADGSNPVNLSEKAKLAGLDILYVSWSPDGTTLAFTAVDSQRDKASVYRISPEGTGAKRLTDYQGSGHDLESLIWAYADYFNAAPRLRLAPVWSPNSHSIAFTEGGSRIVVTEADTGNTRSFPVGSAAIGQDKDAVLSVSWLPDNRKLIYDRAPFGRNSLIGQANYYIYDWFAENLEVLDTLNKNISAIGSGNNSYYLPTCCGVDSLVAGTNAAPTATAKPQASVEGKIVTISGIGLRTLTVYDLATAQPTVITTGPFRGLDASVAPRGDQLVYLEVGDQYSSSLYLTDMTGKQRRKLSEGTGEPNDLSVAVKWSPDSRQVAFQALGNDPNLKPGLYVLPVAAGENEKSAPRLITGADVADFDWSPDSQKLAYRVDDAQYTVYTVSVSSPETTQRALASVGMVNRNYSSLGRGLLWSPDGKLIAVSGPSSYARFATWIISSDGTPREIPSSIINRLVAWTPDSSKVIATVANYNQSTDVQVLSVANSTWRPYGPGSGPRLSSNGQYLTVFSRYDVARFGNSPAANLQRLTFIQLSNGGQKDVELNFPPYYGFRSRFFDWSPDGRNLAYYENNTLWLVGTDGKQPVAIGRGMTVERVIWAGKPNGKN